MIPSINPPSRLDLSLLIVGEVTRQLKQLKEPWEADFKLSMCCVLAALQNKFRSQ